MRMRNIVTQWPKGNAEWCCCCLSYCPVVTVFGLIFWILLSYQLCFVLPIMRQGMVAQAIFCGAGNLIFMGLMLAAFCRATFTNPGFVYSGWELDESLGLPDMTPLTSEPAAVCKSETVGLRHPSAAPEGSRGIPPVFEYKSTTGALRFCRKCNVYKPDRSHHCSDCNRCVLKMDHHCPWINNCVGFANQKYFLLFLFYIPVAAIWNVSTGLMFILKKSDFPLYPFRYINFLAAMVVSGTFGLSLLLFAGFHCNLLCNNRTTIENFEKSRGSLWDQGVLENYKQVFGSRLLPALLPVPSTPGNGFFFQPASVP